MDTLLAKLAVLLGTLGTLAVGLGVPLSTGVGELPQMPQMVQVHVIGERSLNTFDCSGASVTEISTAADYNLRFSGRPNPPKKTGCVWKESVRSTHFDTPDGNIHPGEYALKVEGEKERLLILLPSGKPFNIDKEDFLMLQTIKL